MDDVALSLSRLRWRCRRGMLELDLLLQGFLEHGFSALDEQGQCTFLRILELPDQTLHDYLMGNKEIRETEFIDVIERIRHAAQN